MSRLFSSFFLFLYLAAILVPLYPVLDYALHKEAIAKIYCENKNKPAMHCNGKCHMMKQIKKAAEQAPVSHTNAVVAEQFMPHDTPVSISLADHAPILCCQASFAWLEPLSYFQPASIFHPPCCKA
ncbi:MAG: hypothetical protein ACHQRM_01625 [Bacteroidia bacterium]